MGMRTQLVDQPSSRPTPKLVAGTSTGAGVIVVLWIAQRFGLHLDPEAASAIVLAAASAAAWIKRNGPVIAAGVSREDGAHLDRDGDGRADR